MLVFLLSAAVTLSKCFFVASLLFSRFRAVSVWFFCSALASADMPVSVSPFPLRFTCVSVLFIFSASAIAEAPSSLKLFEPA